MSGDVVMAFIVEREADRLAMLAMQNVAKQTSETNDSAQIDHRVRIGVRKAGIF